MIVYHGSTNRFDKFSYDCIGKNGTTEGIGFYFTNNIDIARGYAWKESGEGYIYSVEFKGTKSLSLTSLTLTKSQVKKLIAAIGDLYLSNVGEVEFEGYNTVLNRAVNDLWDYNDSDVDLICSILNAVSHYQMIFELLNTLFGYDCIIIDSPEWGSHKIYIALVHSVYEIKEIQSYKRQED